MSERPDLPDYYYKLLRDGTLANQVTALLRSLPTVELQDKAVEQLRERTPELLAEIVEGLKGGLEPVVNSGICPICGRAIDPYSVHGDCAHLERLRMKLRVLETMQRAGKTTRHQDLEHFAIGQVLSELEFNMEQGSKRGGKKWNEPLRYSADQGLVPEEFQGDFYRRGLN